MGTELTECNNSVGTQPCNISIVGYTSSCLWVLASGKILPYQSIIYNIYGISDPPLLPILKEWIVHEYSKQIM